MADPWLKFFPTDWRADPALRMCSPAARGVWIDLICLMHEATPYGHLLVNGHCPTDAQIAVLLGTTPEQLSEYIGELEQAGVFSRTKDSVIYSRKMTRLAKKAATARKNGRKGGNPSLGNKRDNPSSVNRRDKGRDKTQKPEARSQTNNNSEDKSSSLLLRDNDFQEFMKVHPKPRDSDFGSDVWTEAIESGMTPEHLISSAKQYANASKKYDPDKVKFSDNWLAERSWEKYPPHKAKTAKDRELIDCKVNENIANSIKSGRRELCGSITATKARDLISLGLVTEAQCKTVMPWF